MQGCFELESRRFVCQSHMSTASAVEVESIEDEYLFESIHQLVILVLRCSYGTWERCLANLLQSEGLRLRLESCLALDTLITMSVPCKAFIGHNYIYTSD